ncbi:Uncharacterised protein [Mycobacteroides abscessus subsp. abscessus]|nr:Uncharacterised protein [Mycobacteroides abscessus subsp. abscessus]
MSGSRTGLTAPRWAVIRRANRARTRREALMVPPLTRRDSVTGPGSLNAGRDSTAT